jgi:hypothetical protein
MTRQQTALLLVLGGTAVAGTVAWYLFSTQQRKAGRFDPTRASAVLAENVRMRPGQILALQRSA